MWLFAGVVFLGAVSLGFVADNAGSASILLTWQWVLTAVVWLVSIAAVWHFLRHLPQGELDFDGENWYFENHVDRIDQVGTVSIRLDLQGGMLLRFESEFKRVSWLWVEQSIAHALWQDLRRAVYSRPTIQNSPSLI